MFSPTDHVAVAVSGGKDSLTLLMILKKLSSRFSQTKITAVTIDEGIAGYREEAVDLASEYCRKLSVDHEIVSFEELYGSGLDDFLRERKDRLTACSYCGVFRGKRSMSQLEGSGRQRSRQLTTSTMLSRRTC